MNAPACFSERFGNKSKYFLNFSCLSPLSFLRGSPTLKTDTLSCFTISLRDDNQILWCIYHGSLIFVHGVTSMQRYGGGLAILVTGFICWPIPKFRLLMMWISLYLSVVESWQGSTSISLSFQIGSLVWMTAWHLAVLRVPQRGKKPAISCLCCHSIFSCY